MPFSRAPLGLGAVMSMSLISFLFVVTPVAASGPVTLAGVVDVEHGDVIASRSHPASSIEYRVLDTGSERLTLVGEGAEKVRPGARVKVRGTRHGGRFVLASENPVTRISGGGENSLTVATSEPSSSRRVAVLVANFEADTRKPWTRAQVADVVFGTNSAAAYWREVSNDAMSISGDVLGYYTLAVSNTTCDYGGWMEAAKSAAAAAGVDVPGYTNVMLVVPRQSACRWDGLGTIGGRNTWINGALSVYVTSHELGHNFGVHHSGLLRCKDEAGNPVALSSRCKFEEYGDPFDVMGRAPRHTNNWHRRQLGFLSNLDQETVTSSGTYKMATVEIDGGSPRILRVARPGGDFFYLEWRQTYGVYDAFGRTAPAVNGVMIRIAPDDGIARSRLIDTVPSTWTRSDAPLVIGRTFTDPTTGISVKAVSADSTGATVSITFGTEDLPVPDTTPPTAPSALVATANKNKVFLSWVGSTDDGGPVRYDVRRDGVVVQTVSTTSTFSVVKSGTYTFAVRARDEAGNVSAWSNSVTIEVSGTRRH